MALVGIYSTRTSKFLWMEERNSEIPHQLTNNRSSESSVSDCTRQMANCCGRGGSSNTSIDFTNKITLNQLSGGKKLTSTFVVVLLFPNLWNNGQWLKDNFYWYADVFPESRFVRRHFKTSGGETPSGETTTLTWFNISAHEASNYSPLKNSHVDGLMYNVINSSTEKNVLRASTQLWSN